MNPPADLAVESKSTPTDVVTIMDKRSEELLVSPCLDGRESDGVLGEEGSDRPGTSGFRWVIDPIDGTVNYLYGLPGWSVCVGSMRASPSWEWSRFRPTASPISRRAEWVPSATLPGFSDR